MRTRGRTLRLTAVVAMVGLALTGFSSGRHHSRGGSGGGDGGGCSSSRQNHGGSSSYRDSDDDSYGSSGSSSGSGGGSSDRRRSTPTSSSTGGGDWLEDATVKLVSCATKKTPYATAEVTNPNGRKGTFTVRVNFMNARDDFPVYFGSTDVTVPAKGRKTVRVRFADWEDITTVDHCEAERDAYPVD
ncbi:hypothetical protein [Streptomyces resistomycificus]|uniref:Uncharacterized protein n=1 Tax=Streptomyces resistomycificus TaxID=67356 RepID=A0A0L8LFS3_9ACTN|nr:hypothetical protein [Streptomyces resistomycificus]KOG36959.1 hypothetical protein ADK37_13175 [Streptomyces resistomycificus]KUN96578.1 hypothetical protein AQJ84_19615 [Streptomyces resistomycificus]